MSVTFSIADQFDYVKYPNFSNTNAREVLNLIGVPYSEELLGTWEGEQLDAVIRGATIALNYSGANYGRPLMQDGRVICCGTSDSNVRGRLEKILNLCVMAKRDGNSVSFG